MEVLEEMITAFSSVFPTSSSAASGSTGLGEEVPAPGDNGKTGHAVPGDALAGGVPCFADFPDTRETTRSSSGVFLNASFVRLVRSNRFCRSRVCNITRQRPALLKARSRTSCEDIELPGVLR